MFNPPHPPGQPQPNRFGWIAALIASVVLFTGCTMTEPTGAEPGDGPAVEQSEPAPETTDPGDEPADSGEPTGTFTDKIVYPDGVEVEFTKIKHGKVSADDAEYDDTVKKGDPYVIFTLRVRNGSEEKLDTLTHVSVTYGPDGEEAEAWIGSKFDLPSGALLPGKAKTGEAAFLIPAKYQDDVTAEVGVTFEHATAIFTGSLK